MAATESAQSTPDAETGFHTLSNGANSPSTVSPPGRKLNPDGSNLSIDPYTSTAGRTPNGANSFNPLCGAGNNTRSNTSRTSRANNKLETRRTY